MALGAGVPSNAFAKVGVTVLAMMRQSLARFPSMAGSLARLINGGTQGKEEAPDTGESRGFGFQLWGNLWRSRVWGRHAATRARPGKIRNSCLEGW